MFTSLTTSDFADRFLSTIKASGNWREIYIKHLALLVCFSLFIHNQNLSYFFQRKFARETQDATCETFKKFRDWLDSKYAAGFPSDEEWEIIVREDEEGLYYLNTNIVEEVITTGFSDPVYDSANEDYQGI